MKFEKRSDGETGAPASPPENRPSGKKPVVIYIMILFIVAFLLMALSFAMHQRSNSEALGELQDSVSAMQEVQATQERIIALQEEAAALQEENAGLREQLAEAEDASNALSAERDGLARRSDALLALYQLQQEYAARDYEACRALIAEFEAGLADALPGESPGGGVVSPAERYGQLKDAVEARTGGGG